jgi:hypothetical protein
MQSRVVQWQEGDYSGVLSIADAGRAADQARARASADANPHGIGAAYVRPPPADDFDAPEWRGVVAVSDGTCVTEALVVAGNVSRNAPFDTDVLAATVERVVAQRGGLSRLDRPDWLGPGIELDKHVDVELGEIFLP